MPVIELVATLILSTVLPTIVETLATAPFPEVSVLSKTAASPTWYNKPPVSIPIFSTDPGTTDLISIVWESLFGI